MGTNANTKFANFALHRLLGAEDFTIRIFNYLLNRIKELSDSYYTDDYVIGDGIGISSSGNDEFDLADLGTSQCVDGIGNFLEPFSSEMLPYHEGVPFENENAVTYHVALEHGIAPNTLAINPRTGLPEWIDYNDVIGVEGDPGNVTDNGDGTITFDIDAMLDLDPYVGRLALVWMPNPAKNAVNRTIALEECVVYQDGGVNKIDTVGSLGQTAISTEESDYRVTVLGPVVSRYTNPQNLAGSMYVGAITGNGPAATPTAFTTINQRVIAQPLPSVFSDGLQQDFYPATDDAYDLGTPSYRWANIYVVNLDIASNFIPAVHNAYDLGATGIRWRDLYLGRDLYVAGSYFGDLIPGADDGYDLGAVSYRWRDVYVSGDVYIDNSLEVANADGAGAGVASNLIPSANDTHQLGTASYRWKGLYLDDFLDLKSTVVGVPVVVRTWSAAAPGNVDGDWTPYVSGTHDLGHIAYRWDTIYGDHLWLDWNNPGDGVITDFNPSADETWDLGRQAYKWHTIYAKHLWLASDAGDGVSSDLAPAAALTYELGIWDRRWKSLWCGVSHDYTSLGGRLPMTIRDGTPYTYKELAAKQFPMCNWNTNWEGRAGTTKGWSMGNRLNLTSANYNRFVGACMCRANIAGDVKNAVVVLIGANGAPKWSATVTSLNTNYVGGSYPQLLVIDPDTLSEAVIYIPASSLPSGSSEEWVPQAIASDGEHVYIHFEDWDTPAATPAAVAHRIQAYDLVNLSGNQAVKKTGWPTTGSNAYGISSNGVFLDSAAFYLPEMAIGGNDQEWLAVCTGASQYINILNTSDGSGLASGWGDYDEVTPGGSFDPRPMAVVWTGDHWMFTMWDKDLTTQECYVCSMATNGANPTLASTPKRLDTGLYSRNFLAPRIGWDGDAAWVYDTKNWDTVNRTKIMLLGYDYTKTAIDFEEHILYQAASSGVDKICGICCDGKEMWIAFATNESGSAAAGQYGQVSLFNCSTGFITFDDMAPDTPLPMQDIIADRVAITKKDDFTANASIPYLLHLGIVCTGDYLFAVNLAHDIEWWMDDHPLEAADQIMPGYVRRVPLMSQS